MQTEDRLTVGAHAATWSRTIRLFADSEAGSQTMRAAGGRERERSRTAADDTAGRRRDTSIRPCARKSNKGTWKPTTGAGTAATLGAMLLIRPSDHPRGSFRQLKFFRLSRAVERPFSGQTQP